MNGTAGEAIGGVGIWLWKWRQGDGAVEAGDGVVDHLAKYRACGGEQHK